ncbi:MAG: hypothetical protein JJE07_11215, partial [Flavobacteriaceae bacterium]|nr:hypothetical protein [Flavobacteriaceae bacterium]
MEIIIAATKTCLHRPLLEKILQDAWLPYKVFYFENHPELIKKYKLKHSPLLIVDEKVEFIGMPEMNQITELISRNKDISENRVPKRTKNHMIPNNINKDPDLVEVDTTWG